MTSKIKEECTVLAPQAHNTHQLAPSSDTETWAPLLNSSMHNTVFPSTNEPCRGSQNVSSAAGGRWSALQHALAAKEAAETERCNTKRIISSFRWHVSRTLMKHNQRIFNRTQTVAVSKENGCRLKEKGSKFVYKSTAQLLPQKNSAKPGQSWVSVQRPIIGSTLQPNFKGHVKDSWWLKMRLWIFPLLFYSNCTVKYRFEWLAQTRSSQRGRNGLWRCGS